MQKRKRTLKAAFRRYGILLLTGCVMFLGGCKHSGAPQTDGDLEDGAQNVDVGGTLTYMERSIDLPEGCSAYDIRQVEDQVLLMTDRGLYTSADRGERWIKSDSFPSVDCKQAAIGPSGNVAWCGESNAVSMWKTDGSVEELHPDFPEDKPCYFMEFLSDEKLLLMNTASDIQVLDGSGDKIVGNIPAGNDYHLLACGVDGKILAWKMNGGVQIWDETGENPKSCELAEQLFKQAVQDGLGMGSFGVLTADLDNTGFFYGGVRGLFHYTLGGSVTEQLIEGGQTAMGDNNYRLHSLAPLADGSFLALYTDMGAGKDCLKRYDIRSAKERENQAELTLYTLYDDDMVRQELNVLMQENPEYVISVQVGVSGENGVTPEDAIKTLNTEIMAGEGPDLILLDGIAVEPYIEKGILADLSDVINQVDEEEGLARNITDVYTSGEGIYAVPARFLMPLIMGKQTDIDRISDLDSLADCVRQVKEENPEVPAVLGMYGRTYLNVLFDICAPAWITKEGVDQEKLKEFLETAGRMQEIQQEGISEDAIKEVTEISDRYGGENDTLDIDFASGVRFGYQNLALFSSRSLNTSMGMVVSGFGYDVAKGQSSRVFVPREIIGVNDAGPNVEQAKRFVHDFLSDTAQSQFVLSGLAYPVNKTALNGSMEAELNREETLQEYLADSDATEEDVRAGLEKIIAMTGELDTCAVNDDVMRSIVIDHGMNYLNGQESLEQAASAIVQGLKLRLAE